MWSDWSTGAEVELSNGIRLDTPGWGYGQVWSTESLCREHAWSMPCVGRRFYDDLDVRLVLVVGPALFRLACDRPAVGLLDI